MFRNEELYGSYRGKVRGIKTYIHRHTQRPQAHEHTPNVEVTLEVTESK